ncbi:hypothetical protein JXJ21_02030 [candidate division KSB1 bacterium]|nr:hypothetical protein [candidate division KSB1 bacterium]
MAVIVAYAWGKDQNNNDVKVWAENRVIFSRGIHTFTAIPDKTVLDAGESANIEIRLFDIHGNPVAAGSSLSVSTTEGELSDSELMPDESNYGFGTTYFSTQLMNTYTPEDSILTTARVTISLSSPNGSGKINLPFTLKAGLTRFFVVRCHFSIACFCLRINIEDLRF